MFAQILEPFKGIRNIIQFAALPRIFMYLCFAVVFWILSTRTSDLMRSIHLVTQEKELLKLQNSITDKVARYEEREKLTRDIHNSVGHTITAAIMAIDAAEAVRSVNPEIAESKIAAAGERMRESLQAIRESVRLVDNKDTSVSLGDLLRTLAISLRQFEIDTNMRIKDNLANIFPDVSLRIISAEHARFLYGAVQECLTNCVRHGKASNASLTISVGSDFIEMLIVVEGIGRILPELPENKGSGLKKISTYLKNNGGYLTYQSGPGFSVKIWLPIEETD
jgi:signal transduction histidine kinase